MRDEKSKLYGTNVQSQSESLAGDLNNITEVEWREW